MGDFATFLSMGGYAQFVWPAYGVTLLVLALLVGRSLLRLRRLERQLERLDAGRPRRSRSRS